MDYQSKIIKDFWSNIDCSASEFFFTVSPRLDLVLVN